jgi:hypothetical protein
MRRVRSSASEFPAAIARIAASFVIFCVPFFMPVWNADVIPCGKRSVFRELGGTTCV